jgi:putative transposase
MTYLAFKYKLKPTQVQKEELVKMAGCGRFLWNYFLDLNQKQYNEEKKFMFYPEMNLNLTQIKKKEEMIWLNDASSIGLQNRLMDLDCAIRRCYKNKFGFPKFKKKNDNSDTIRISQVGKHINPKKKEIKIPKLGWVKWIKHRPLQGKLKSITIKQEGDQWYCVCLCEDNTEIKQKQLDFNDLVGIDLGLNDFLVTSDGLVVDTPKLYRKKQKKLKHLQRKLTKKQKGSKNREKARKKVRKLHLKIRNQRQDFTHKASNLITKSYGFVGVEDLNIKGMKKNRHLSKSISDQGWAMFIQQLEYKSIRNGGCTVKIDRWAPSTKTCSNCGKKHQLTLSQRQMKCDCGLDISRDLNAAINIRNWSWDILSKNTDGTSGIKACGDTSDGLTAIDVSSYVLTKQEKHLTIG